MRLIKRVALLLISSILFLSFCSVVYAEITDTNDIRFYYSFDDADWLVNTVVDLGPKSLDGTADAGTSHGMPGAINESWGDWNTGKHIAVGSTFNQSSYCYGIALTNFTNAASQRIITTSGGQYQLTINADYTLTVQHYNGGSFKPAGPSTSTGHISSTATSWTHVIVTYDGTNVWMYMNGTYQFKQATPPLGALEIMWLSHSNPAVDMHGQMDEFVFYGDNCSTEVVGMIYGNYTDLIQYPFEALPGPPVPENAGINVTIFYPTYGNKFIVSNMTDNIYINGTHNETSDTTCGVNDTRWTSNGPNVDMGWNFTFINNTALNTTTYFNIIAFCNKTTTKNGTDYVEFSIDSIYPLITINPNNFFKINNMSTQSQYGKYVDFNITFFDDNLFGESINITNSSFYQFYYNQTESIVGTYLNYTRTLNISNFTEGVYKNIIYASDDHTMNRIDDYAIDRFVNKISFDTEEKNRVEISSVGAYNTRYTKSLDRYSFGFDYLLSDTARTFILESDKKIIYLPYSKYKAHFVVWNSETKAGNWIDFEGIGGSYVVQKESDYRYRIVFTDLIKDTRLMLNSIGGLNINHIEYEWYRGNYTLDYDSPVVGGIQQTITLTMTKKPGYVEDINVSLIYNNTARLVTKNVVGEEIIFTSNFAPPEIAKNYNFTFYINVSQNDTSSYNFTLDRTQGVVLPAIVVFIYDEENQTLIDFETVSVFFSLEQSLSTTTANGIAYVNSLTPGIYRIEASSVSYPRRGIYYNITGANTTINLSLVVDAIGNDYIDYFLRSATQEERGDPIEDAFFTFNRTINGTSRIMAQFYTDYAGQIQIFQDQQATYDITIEHPEFPTKVINLQPILTSYNLLFDQTLYSYYSNVYEGISYRLLPQEKVLNVSQIPTNVSISIFADDLSLEYFGVKIINHSYVCDPVTCLFNVTGSPAGGVASVLIYGNVSGTMDVQYFFKRAGFDVQYIHGSLYGFDFLDISEELIGSRLTTILTGIHSQFPTAPMRNVFAAILITVMCAIGASIGIIGAPMIGVATFGTIIMTLTGFLYPIVGIIMTVVGIAAFAILMEQQ